MQREDVKQRAKFGSTARHPVTWDWPWTGHGAGRVGEVQALSWTFSLTTVLCWDGMVLREIVGFGKPL